MFLLDAKLTLVDVLLDVAKAKRINYDKKDFYALNANKQEQALAINAVPFPI